MRKIKNSDFKILLPEEVAGRELAANDSVELRVYTVNADNYYKFEYEGGQVPEEQKVDASCMVTMESGVVMYLLLAHIADTSMPDGYFDLQEEITSDYYWIKTQEQSAQEQINELRKDILEEAEVREAADDQLNKSIEFLSDDLEALSDQVDDLEAIHAADIEALSGAVSSVTEDMTSKFNQIDADQAAQNTRITTAISAIGDLDSRLTQRLDQIDIDQETQNSNIAAVSGAVNSLDDRLSRRIDTVHTENLVQDTKIQSLSGAIDTERSVRNQAIEQLSETHAEDIEYLNQRIDSIPQFDPSTIEGEITALSGKVNTMQSEATIMAGHIAENASGITALETQMSRKADASSLQNYAQASALTAVQTDVEDLEEEVEYHTTQIGNLQSTKLDASAYTQVDLTNYYTKDVIDENERVTSEALNDLNTKKLDSSAYTAFDPSVLEDYQPVSGMSGYATTQYVDNALANIDIDGYVSQEDYDSSQQATSAALNELKQTKLDSSAFTEFDQTVLDDYVSWQDFDSYMSSKVYGKSDIDTMLGDYYDKTEIDTMIGDINAALSNINGV